MGCLLADGLVKQNRAANGLPKSGRCDEHLSVRLACLRSLRNAHCGEPLVAGGITFIHRQQALVVGDQRLRGID
jgi:hypothetical protein